MEIFRVKRQVKGAHGEEMFADEEVKLEEPAPIGGYTHELIYPKSRKAKNLGSLRDRIVEAVTLAGDRGITMPQLAKALGWSGVGGPLTATVHKLVRNNTISRVKVGRSYHMTLYQPEAPKEIRTYKRKRQMRRPQDETTKMVEQLLESKPRGMTNKQIANATGYKVFGGTIYQSLKVLKNKGTVVQAKRGNTPVNKHVKFVGSVEAVKQPKSEGSVLDNVEDRVYNFVRQTGSTDIFEFLKWSK